MGLSSANYPTLDAVQPMVQEMVDRAGPRTDESWVVAISTGVANPSLVGRAIELSVFSEFFGNDVSVMEREYGAYEEQSLFIVVIDRRTAKPGGAMRIIGPGPAGLKAVADMRTGPWNLQRKDDLKVFESTTSREIASIAVLPDYRGTPVSLILMRSMYRRGKEHGVRRWLTLLDETPLRLLRTFGLPVDVLEDVSPEPYMGSEATVPCVIEMSGVESEVAMRNPSMYRLLGLGEGIDEMCAFQDWTTTDVQKP